MKKILLFLLAVTLLVPAAVQAAGMVTFEDLNPGYETDAILPPAGYAGFNWSSEFGVITKKYHPGSGYDLGSIGYMAGYTRFANDVYFEGVGGKDFFFIGVFITAAWDAQEDVVVKGYLNGSEKYSTTITTYNDAPYYFAFMWPAVDKVSFAPDGSHIVIDNIAHCNPVPVPGALLLVGSGLLGLMGRRIRK